MGQAQTGIVAIKGKNIWLIENHEMHGGDTQGPFPHENHFLVYFKFDVTPKHTGKPMSMEKMSVFTVENDKIIKEEFFYSMGECR